MADFVEEPKDPAGPETVFPRALHDVLNAVGAGLGKLRVKDIIFSVRASANFLAVSLQYKRKP